MLTGPLPRQVDHRKFAAEKVKLEGAIPVAEFGRLIEVLEDNAGEVAVKLQFRKGKGQKPFATGVCAGAFTMVCQGCLEPITVNVTADIRSLIVDSDEELMELGQGEDGMVCTAEYVKLVDLIEDDLLVALPMVPKHPDGECESIRPGDEEPGSKTYKPFAGLAELTKDLKRS